MGERRPDIVSIGGEGGIWDEVGRGRREMGPGRSSIVRGRHNEWGIYSQSASLTGPENRVDWLLSLSLVRTTRSHRHADIFPFFICHFNITTTAVARKFTLQATQTQVAGSSDGQ